MMEDFSEYNGEGTDLRRAQMRMLDILTEIELDEGETLEEYKEMAWKDDRIFEYANELETLNKVLSVKYGEEG